ncbi:Pkinase-domain-containing protein, partial [Ceraceosorus guamensis]
FKGCSPVDMYDVGQKLGQGTFGVVERAKHKVTGNDVAMKRVTIHDEKDGFPLTAIREIKLLKRLSHPAIVPVIDMAYRRFSDRRPREIYMIEPYMDHDLNGMLENPSISFTPSQMKLYMKQLLEGTLYMHQNKILHRDMKAANLLINNEGQLQIADFGLARPFRDPGHAWKRDGWKGGDAAQAYTEMVVTRWYRPPELLAGERKYGPPIDMWGLGCILAEMVIKGPLFKGTSEINQLELIAQLCGSPNEKNYPGWNSLPGEPGRHDFGNHPRRVIEHFTKGPVNLADLIDKLLVLDPRKRMTAEEALQHEWFWQTPYPALPTSLPRYEASKEIDRQQLR